MKMLKILIASSLMVSLQASQDKSKTNWNPFMNNEFVVSYPEHNVERMTQLYTLEQVIEKQRSSSSWPQEVIILGGLMTQLRSKSVETGLGKVPEIKDLK